MYIELLSLLTAIGSILTRWGMRDSNSITGANIGSLARATIIGSSPLFSTIFAAIFLAEEVTLSVFAGTVLIVGGWPSPV